MHVGQQAKDEQWFQQEALGGGCGEEGVMVETETSICMGGARSVQSLLSTLHFPICKVGITTPTSPNDRRCPVAAGSSTGLIK